MDKGQIEAPSSIDFKEETIMKKSKTILTCAAAACLLVSGIGFACAEGAQTYVIDDAELERVKANYPVIWKNPDAEPQLCFVGCPHMTLRQLIDWTTAIGAELNKNGLKKVTVPTVFTASTPVIKEFEKTPYYKQLKRQGIILSYICPLMYMNNPLCKKKAVITSSNKLRTYTSARYYTEAEILHTITTKREGKK